MTAISILTGSLNRKKYSLKNKKEIIAVLKYGKRYSGTAMRLHITGNNLLQNRLLITTRKYPGAVARNKAKRLIREIWRGCLKRMQLGYDIAVVLFPGFDFFTKRSQELHYLLTKAKVLR